jgi:hypothetical protein
LAASLVGTPAGDMTVNEQSKIANFATQAATCNAENIRRFGLIVMGVCQNSRNQNSLD